MIVPPGVSMTISKSLLPIIHTNSEFHEKPQLFARELRQQRGLQLIFQTLSLSLQRDESLHKPNYWIHKQTNTDYQYHVTSYFNRRD